VHSTQLHVAAQQQLQTASNASDDRMRNIATDVPVRSCVTRLRPAKTAERIEVPFGVKAPRGLRNTVVGEAPIPLSRRGGGEEERVADYPTYSHSPDGANFDDSMRLSLNHFSHLFICNSNLPSNHDDKTCDDTDAARQHACVQSRTATVAQRFKN